MIHEQISYEQFRALLRSWVSMQGEGDYDFVGMFHLFHACVLNLSERSTNADWEQVEGCLGPAERAFLLRVARGHMHSSAGDDDR